MARLQASAVDGQVTNPLSKFWQDIEIPRNKLGALHDMGGLLGDAWDYGAGLLNNPSPIEQRGGVLPLGRMEDGSLGLAWPQVALDAAEAFKAPGDAYSGKLPQVIGSPDVDSVGRATNLAGMLTLGNLSRRVTPHGAPEAAPIPDPIIPDTPVAPEPRGFTAWHQSNADFDKFSDKFPLSGYGKDEMGPGLYFSPTEPKGPSGYGGKTYEVRIDADPASFIDDRLPYSQQSDAVKEALERLGVEPPVPLQAVDEAQYLKDLEFHDRVFGDTAEHRRPKLDDYRDYQWTVKGKKVHPEVSSGTARNTAGNMMNVARDHGRINNKQFSKAGIQGFKSSEEMVVFDPEKIAIVRKYGIPAALAAGLLTEEEARQMGEM